MVAPYELEIAPLFEHLRDAVLAVDAAEERVVLWNRAAEALFGYTKAEALGMPTSRLVPMLLKDSHAAGLRAFMQNRRHAGAAADRPLEVPALRKDGSLIPVTMTFATLADESKSSSLILATVRELFPITQAETTETTRASRRADTLQAIGRLAAGVAHDINNDLAALLAPIEWLRLSAETGAVSWNDVLRELTFMERVVQDAARTVQRLQLFARGSDNRDLRRQIVYPDDILDDVIALTRPRWRDQAQAEGRRVEIVKRAGAAPAVSADPADLREILVNLVNNAVDAMPEGGVLTLSTGVDARPGWPRRVVLAVSDTGVGVDATTRAHLFESFYTTKETGRGSGLGLTMVADVVRDLGGEVEVASAPGAGSTFQILLLPTSEASLAAPSASGSDEPSPLAPRRILLVEDEEGLRRVVVRLLKRDGHVVQAAASAEEALSMLDHPDPPMIDAVIADIGLPGLSGWQLTAEIRRRWPALPIVLATGWAGGITDEQLQAAGVPRSALVAKPYHLNDLRRALAAIEQGSGGVRA